jgi:S-DNA-T family DNA segregation ATPase FtsK/SpoIIIE
LVPIPRDGAPERYVFDAELVDDEPVAELRQVPRPRLVARGRGAAVITTMRNPVARVGLAAARAGWLIGHGGLSMLRRAGSALTHGALRAEIRAAQATGERELIAKLLAQLEHAKNDRSQRLKDLPQAVAGVLTTAGVAAAVVFGLLVIGGIGVGVTAGGVTWGEWWSGVGTVLVVGGTALQWALWAAMWLAPAVALVLLYREGQRADGGPRWLRVAADDEDLVIDESTIARALDALRIQPISQYLKAGGQLAFLTPARRDGRGTHAVIRLPVGAAAELVTTGPKRAALAAGLHRAVKEVYPTTGSEAGILDLWVADKGALDEGAGPYPLLTSGTVDVFKGVPFGKLLRGDPLLAPVMERNTMCGGMPGQGKSAAARVLMAGAALDPTAELWILVPDSNFDFEAFRPRCSRYRMGAEDERIEEILADLEDLEREVQRRGERLIRYEIPAVTRTYASRGVGLHPMFVLLEEAHVCIQHKTHGRRISELLCSIVRLGRKRGIHIIVSTQAPTKDSMPRDVTRNCSNGVAFAVGDHVANDALLGQGAYAGGHRATELIPGTDRGTAVVKGFSGQRSEICQVYFLDVEKGRDLVSPIIARSLQAIAEAGRAVPGTGMPAPAVEKRDLLVDLAEAIGDEPLTLAAAARLLTAHAPDWPRYRSLTGKTLGELLLRDCGMRLPNGKNRRQLDPAAVRDELARRSLGDG